MRREEDIQVSCGEILKVQPKTIVHTRVQAAKEGNIDLSCEVTSSQDEVTSSFHITLCDETPIEVEDAEEAPHELEEGVRVAIDELKEVDLGTPENPRPIFISTLLSNEDEKIYVELLKYIVPVRKKNGQIRVCVDFRDLNVACSKDDFPLPITELMIYAMTGHEIMSFMDGSSGYNHIRMAPEDEELAAFRTPKGIYCYKVMPFGLKNAGATYQRAMQRIFDDMLHKMVECYVDDLVVKSKVRIDHLGHLRKVFDRLRKFQLKMNPLKCAFGVAAGKSFFAKESLSSSSSVNMGVS
nr:Transposon Ty3-G Gag-Pol polyprotein [Ipomoea batatas]